MLARFARHTFLMLGALSILIGVASPALSPFFLETASATATPVETIKGGVTTTSSWHPELLDEYGKKVTCEAHIEQARLDTDLIANSLGFSKDNIDVSMGLVADGVPIDMFPGNGDTGTIGIEYTKYLLNPDRIGKMVNVIRLYQAESSLNSTPCGSKFGEGPAGYTMVPICATPGPAQPTCGNNSDVTVWMMAQISALYTPVFGFTVFEKTGPTEDGIHGRFKNLLDANDLSNGNRTVEADVAGEVVSTPTEPPPSVNAISGSYYDIATIDLTFDIEGEDGEPVTVHERYVDHNWDQLSFYFLESTDYQPRKALTYSANGIDTTHRDPLCEPGNNKTPYIWVQSGGWDRGRDCEEGARDAFNLNFDRSEDDFKTRIKQQREWTGNVVLVDYNTDGTFTPTSDARYPGTPRSIGITPINRENANVWFYFEDAERSSIRSAFASGDANETLYLGSYAYYADTDSYRHADADCDILGQLYNKGTQSLHNAPVESIIDANWLLIEPGSRCQENYANLNWDTNDEIRVRMDLDRVDQIPTPEDQDPPTVDECTRESRPFGWVICPSMSFLGKAAVEIDKLVIWLVKVDADDIFVARASAEQDNYFRVAWILFRNIAYALLVILGLIMVVSQVAGLDLFDAYSIRKMLPKLVAATIIIPLLWPILEIVTNMANDSADAIGQLIEGPFQIQETSLLADWVTGLGLTGGALAAGITFAALGGTGVVLALIGSVVLAILQAFVVIAARDLVFYILIIASPVAVALAIFEPFKKGFDMWRKLLTGILLSIPTVAAVLAVSKVGATIAQHADYPLPGIGTIFEITFIIVGYIMFWPILKSMDKVAGQIDGMADKVTSGAQKALSKYRGETLKRRWQEYRNGQRGSTHDGVGLRHGKWKGLLNAKRWVRSAARQANIMEAAGQAGGSYRGAHRIAAAQMHEFQTAADLLEKAKKHGEHVTGNSELNQAIHEEGERRAGESKAQYVARVAARMTSYAKAKDINDARDKHVDAARAAHVEDARAAHVEDARAAHVAAARAEVEGRGGTFDAAAEATAHASFNEASAHASFKEEDAHASFEVNKAEAVKKQFDEEKEADGTTRAEKVEKTFKDTKEVTLQAKHVDDVKTAETAYGVEAGSSTFWLMGAMSSGADSTAWRQGAFKDTTEARERFVAGLAKMVDHGIIDDVMATKILTQNKARLDLAGGGFGETMRFVAGAGEHKTAEGVRKIATDAVMGEAKARGETLTAEATEARVAARLQDKSLAAADTKEYRRQQSITLDGAIRRGNPAHQVFSQRHETARIEAIKRRENLELLSDAVDVETMPASVGPDGRRTLDTSRLTADHAKQLREIAARRGITGSTPEEIYSGLHGYLQSERALRDLAVDKVGRALSAEEAMIRESATMGSAYQYMLHNAPQNRDYVSDIALTARVRLPVSAPIRVPEGVEVGDPRYYDPKMETREITETSTTEFDEYPEDEVDDSGTLRRVYRRRPKTITRNVQVQVGYVPKKAVQVTTMTWADAMEAIKREPHLAEVWKLHGYDPYAAAGRAQTTFDPGDPAAMLHPPGME